MLIDPLLIMVIIASVLTTSISAMINRQRSRYLSIERLGLWVSNRERKGVRNRRIPRFSTLLSTDKQAPG